MLLEDFHCEYGDTVRIKTTDGEEYDGVLSEVDVDWDGSGQGDSIVLDFESSPSISFSLTEIEKARLVARESDTEMALSDVELGECRAVLKDGSRLGAVSSALSKLIESKCYDEECVLLAMRFKSSHETLAFHYPLSELAMAYLHLAGKEEYAGDNETTIGLIKEYGECRFADGVNPWR